MLATVRKKAHFSTVVITGALIRLMFLTRQPISPGIVRAGRFRLMGGLLWPIAGLSDRRGMLSGIGSGPKPQAPK